jgi:hypothetical protein
MVKPTRNDKRQGLHFSREKLADSPVECQELELQEVLKAKAQFPAFQMN